VSPGTPCHQGRSVTRDTVRKTGTSSSGRGASQLWSAETRRSSHGFPGQGQSSGERHDGEGRHRTGLRGELVRWRRKCQAGRTVPPGPRSAELPGGHGATSGRSPGPARSLHAGDPTARGPGCSQPNPRLGCAAGAGHGGTGRAASPRRCSRSTSPRSRTRGAASPRRCSRSTSPRSRTRGAASPRSRTRGATTTDGASRCCAATDGASRCCAATSAARIGGTPASSGFRLSHTAWHHGACPVGVVAGLPLVSSRTRAVQHCLVRHGRS
jgi:hypothetical protein